MFKASFIILNYAQSIIHYTKLFKASFIITMLKASFIILNYAQSIIHYTKHQSIIHYTKLCSKHHSLY